MTRTIKYILIISGILLASSTVGLFLMDKLISPIIWFIAINSLIATIALLHLKKTNSVRIFGVYLLIAMVLYNWINYEPNWGIESIFYLSTEHLNYTSRTIIAILLMGYGIFQVVIGGLFEQLLRSTAFKLSIILLFVFLFTEMPIYDIHGDFGGNSHGHNYIKGMHFH